MDDLKQVLRADYSMYLEDENMNIESLLEAADRIERLEGQLAEVGDILLAVKDEREQERAQAADRIERLEAALRDVAAWYVAALPCVWGPDVKPSECPHCIARRALDGEDQ